MFTVPTSYEVWPKSRPEMGHSGDLQLFKDMLHFFALSLRSSSSKASRFNPSCFPDLGIRGGALRPQAQTTKHDSDEGANDSKVIPIHSCVAWPTSIGEKIILISPHRDERSSADASQPRDGVFTSLNERLNGLNNQIITKCSRWNKKCRSPD